nr:hypothetical protein [uncultured Acetobacterium sp.]
MIGKGDDDMAQEIIAAVRKAEIQAEQTEKMAIDEKNAIIKQSKKETELLISAMIKEEKHQAESALAEAKKLGSQMIKEAEAGAEIEICQLRETAKRKEDQIVSLIIAELI